MKAFAEMFLLFKKQAEVFPAKCTTQFLTSAIVQQLMISKKASISPCAVHFTVR